MSLEKNIAPPHDARRQPAREPPPADASAGAQKLLAVGSVLGALAASSCCILPLALFGLGVSGAWIGNLTRLAPYQPYFVAFTAACLSYGFWLTHRSRRRGACPDDAACARSLPNRLVISAFILAIALVASALAAHFLIPLVFA